MTPERRRRISELFHAAGACAAGTREAYLAAACGQDTDLRREVESLLACDREAALFLEVPALDGLVEVLPASAAPSLIGRQIGTFRVVALMGVGGMGTVYRAHDTRLGRDVALKILPEDLTADPARRARFEREARVLATLNHPHIAAIYGVADAEDLSALVLELVEGGTLADRLATGPLPVSDALTLAREVAEALAAAHDKGIVHRDLKPANVGLTVDGAVKVLDFGLAKAVAGEARESTEVPSVNGTVGRTRDGMLLGTPAYMSPEQARGSPTERPTDIWAFGCLLFEMLTGRPPFEGATVTDTLDAIGTRQPDWNLLPASVPASVRHLVQRCLDKEARRRLRKIADAVVVFENVKKSRDRSRQRWTWAALGLATTVSGFLAWQTWRVPAPADSYQAVPLTTLPGMESYPSLSPDGYRVAFMWTGPSQDNPDIYVQTIGSSEPERRTSDPRSDYNPVWSPDGRWIAFLRADRLPPLSQPAGSAEVWVIPRDGGPERPVTTIHTGNVGSPGFLAWSTDSKRLVVTDSPAVDKPDALFVVSPDTVARTQLTSPERGGDCNPALSPDGQALIFRRVVAPRVGELYLLRLGKGLTAVGEPKRLTDRALDAAYPAWINSEEILFSSNRNGPGGGLWRLNIMGGTAPERIPFAGDDSVMPAVSRALPDGSTRLVYSRSSVDQNIWRVDVPTVGAQSLSPPAPAISSTREDVVGDLSPDGARVAFASNRSGRVEIWLANRDGSNAVALTSMNGRMTAAPRWSPNGQLITFQSNVEGQFHIYVVAAAGGQPKRLTGGDGGQFVPSFSRDGQWIYFGMSGIWKVPAAGGDPVQVAPRGFRAIEGWDGNLYYTDTAGGPSGLWRAPTSGGRPVKLLDGVISNAFDVVDRGVYYVDRLQGQARLRFFDFATEAFTTVTHNLGEVGPLLTASRDGRLVFYTRLDSANGDLMLVENFR